MNLLFLSQLLNNTQTLEAKELFQQIAAVLEQEELIPHPDNTTIYQAEYTLLQISLALLYRDFLKNCSSFPIPKISFGKYLTEMGCPSDPLQIGYLLGRFGASELIEENAGIGKCVLHLLRVSYRNLILQTLEEEWGFGRMVQLFSQSEASADWNRTSLFFEEKE